MNSNHSAAAIRSNANSSNGAPRTVQFYYVTFNYICFTILNKLLYSSFFKHCPFYWFFPLFDGIRKLSTVYHANLISKRKAFTAHSGSRSNSCNGLDNVEQDLFKIFIITVQWTSKLCVCNC